MFKTRFALFGVLALFIVSGIGASTASATGGPFWHVNGTKLSKETKQLNLQAKGNAVLNGKVSLLAAVIECSVSSGEGTTIEGNGAQKPGQGKGKLKFTSCTTKIAANSTNCKVQEPITTNQSKARLVTFPGAQTKYGVLFEPQQENTFVSITFENQGTNKCPVAGKPFAVSGKAAAEIIPKEQESQEGLLVFPGTPIAKVLWFGNEQTKQPEEVPVKLELGGEEAKFSAVYAAKLATGEPFGVFST